MEFHLDSFDGPLDLLLHLISKNKVSIYDIPIAEILEQYMEVLREAETMDMDVAGDFIAMAAQLVYIKSRMLLPQREETPGEDDPRAELVDMLLEYQRFRQATAFFREKGEEGADMLTKAPEPLGDAPREVHGVPNDLIRAANRLLRRVRDFAQVIGTGTIDRKSADIALRALEIDELGLDNVDRRMLKSIIQNYGGGPVGLDTLAATIGEEAITLEDVYEPYLMQIGFLSRTPRGRCVTLQAYRHLNLEPADGQQML